MSGARDREDISIVTELVRTVANALGFDAEELDTVLRAAELHDVGKLAIPDEILHKAGPLDSTEWEFMKQHAAIGERILCAAPALTPGREARSRGARALGRRGIPGPHHRRCDPARLANHRRVRRLCVDDLVALIP